MAKNRGTLHKPHVYVRETPEGPKYTIVMRGIPGGEHPLPVGTSEREVDALVDRYKGKRRKSDGRIRQTTRRYTLADGWDNFERVFRRLVELEEASQATWDEVYEPGWRLHIELHSIAKKAMDDVTPADVKEMSQDMRVKLNPRQRPDPKTGERVAKPYGNSLARRCETILRSIFREARLASMTENDPFKDLSSGQGGLAPDEPLKPPRKPLSAKELRKLVANLTDYYWDECAMLSGHPVRTSELLGVRPRDIDLTGLGPDSIELPIQIEEGDAEVTPGTPAIYYRVQARRKGPGHKRTKNTLAVRPLPLSAAQVEIIARRWEVEEVKHGKLDPDQPFFTRPDGKPVTRSAIYQAVEDAAKRAGIGHATPKDLRMSLATAFTVARVPEKVAASAEGHTEAVRWKHYDRSNLIMDATVSAFAAIHADGFDLDPEELVRRGVRKEEA